MHDIDNTFAGYETDQDLFETEAEGFEMEYPTDMWSGNPFSEEQEMELVSELMGVASDEELEQFLGKLFKSAVKGARRLAPHAIRAGRSLIKIARPMIKQHLPSLAQAATPAISTALGAVPYAGPALSMAAPFVIPALGKAVAGALEMEMEGLDPDEYEFEAAKRYVNIFGSAAQQLAKQARRDLSPVKAAGNALVQAARKHVPGIDAVSGRSSKGRSGRWERRGNTIVLMGV